MFTEELHNRFAEGLVLLRQHVVEVLSGVADADLPAVAAGLRDLAKPQPDRNFPMPDYERLAELVDEEARVREKIARTFQCNVDCVLHRTDASACAALHPEDD